MFLFEKKTRNIIKFIWGVFAVVIILSMIITYSGFTTLSRTQPQNTDLTPEQQAQVEQALATGSSTVTTDDKKLTPEMQRALNEAIAREAASGSAQTATLSPAIIPEAAVPAPEPEKPPVPKLDFSI